MKIPVSVQYRHIHLSSEDLGALFGVGKELTIDSRCNQKGQVIYKETISVVGTSGVFDQVRILGPCREKTQIELSLVDAYAIGIDAPVRLSGDLARTASCKLRSAAGEIDAKAAVIVPIRHLHLDPLTAKKLAVEHGQLIAVKKDDLLIDQVTVRIHPSYRPSFHLTYDEAAEFWLSSSDFVTIF
jgi:putative phosphotransacetylase